MLRLYNIYEYDIVHNHKHFRDAADWPYIQETVFTLLDIDEDDYQDYVEDTESLQKQES